MFNVAQNVFTLEKGKKRSGARLILCPRHLALYIQQSFISIDS